MNTATQALLIITLTTVVLPLLSGATLSFFLTRSLVQQNLKSLSSLFGVILSCLVSFVGILSFGQLWGVDAIRYLFWLPVLAGAFWELGSVFLPRKLSSVWLEIGASIASLCLFLIATYLLSSPLKGLWSEGINPVLLNGFLIPIIAISFLGLRFNLRAIDQETGVRPHYFASLAITFGFAAPVIGLSGSASLAQLLVAFGLSVAGIGLMALWQDFLLTKSSYFTAYLTLFSTLLYAHLYLSPALSPSLFCLLILAPSCGALVSRWQGSPIKNTLLAIVFSLPLLLLALGLVTYKEFSVEASSQEVDEFGASY
ncbi:MAG: hypothetical protein CMH49_03785 [Myxococcales bacterium]|nr:hypothetical protein [Myxococcales bacterium]